MTNEQDNQVTAADLAPEDDGTELTRNLRLRYKAALYSMLYQQQEKEEDAIENMGEELSQS